MKKIVLVDDNENFLEMLKELVKAFHKVECITFSNPVCAYEYIARNHDVGFLITDYEMPQMNGFVLAQKLLGLNNNIQITICSGHDKGTLIQTALLYSLQDKVNVCEKLTIVDYIKGLKFN